MFFFYFQVLGVCDETYETRVGEKGKAKGISVINIHISSIAWSGNFFVPRQGKVIYYKENKRQGDFCYCYCWKWLMLLSGKVDGARRRLKDAPTLIKKDPLFTISTSLPSRQCFFIMVSDKKCSLLNQTCKKNCKISQQKNSVLPYRCRNFKRNSTS